MPVRFPGRALAGSRFRCGHQTTWMRHHSLCSFLTVSRRRGPVFLAAKNATKGLCGRVARVCYRTCHCPDGHITRVWCTRHVESAANPLMKCLGRAACALTCRCRHMRLRICDYSCECLDLLRLPAPAAARTTCSCTSCSSGVIGRKFQPHSPHHTPRHPCHGPTHTDKS